MSIHFLITYVFKSSELRIISTAQIFHFFVNLSGYSPKGHSLEGGEVDTPFYLSLGEGGTFLDVISIQVGGTLPKK